MHTRGQRCLRCGITQPRAWCIARLRPGYFKASENSQCVLVFFAHFSQTSFLFQSTDVLRGSNHGDILKRSYPELREAVSEVGFNGNGNGGGDSMMFETCTNVSTTVGQQQVRAGDRCSVQIKGCTLL